MGLFRRPTPTDPAEIDRLRSELASLRAAFDEHDRAARRFDERLSTLDHRITSVSTELANQLTELGQDIDALGTHVEPDALGAVRDGQVKLANEQARYQIAFREDLARLAEQLQRTR